MAPRNACGAIALALLAVAVAHPAAAAASGPSKGFGRTADPLEGVKNAIRLKNFTGAQSDLQRLADAGNAEAQYLLAVFFLNGLGGPRDPVQAKLWLEKSASQGNARAAFSLASLYAESDSPDPQAAQRWFTRARELGFTAPPRSAQSSAPKGPATAESILIPATRITDAKVKREALWLAAEQGDMASLEALASAPLVTETDEFGRGALARAAEAGNAPALEVLLRRGAPVDAADQYGMTALMLAARAGSAASVEVLLHSRANVSAVDHKGNTALMHWAAATARSGQPA